MSNATDMRDAYIAAELAVLKGQRYSIAGRDLTRADLAEIRVGRREWERRVLAETDAAAGMRSSVLLADFSGCE